MKTTIFIVSIAVSLLLISCTSFFTPVMGSREYTPHSDQERIEFEKANRNVHPDDVRQNISVHENTTIAWLGIIQERSAIDEKDHMEMIFLIKHHYYDWIEDITPGWETHWLSLKGEGLFKAKIGFEKEDLAVREEWGTEGNMVDDDNVIYINTTIVFFAGGNYTTRRLTYDRSDHPY